MEYKIEGQPLPVVICQLRQGEASTVGWTFFNLEWYFGIMTNNYGAVPVGDYTVEFFCDGEYVCNNTFRVIN